MPAPAPDLSASGSGLDLSQTGASQRADAALADLHQQQLEERLYGGILIFGAIVVAIMVASFWRNRNRIAEGAAQSAIRAADNAVEKNRKWREWWKNQAEKARADRK